jgi:O-antigen/teichoic acid export membrane protein
MFRITREPNAPEIYSRVVTYYLFITGWVLVGIGSLRTEVIDVLGGEAYRAADRVVLLILFSYLCHGLYYIFNVGVSTTDRTRLIPVVVGVGAAVNLLANLVLIPRYGILGAAWATAASFVTIAAIMYFTGRRYVPIPAEKFRLLLLAVTSTAILLVNLRVIGEGGGAAQTVARALLALSFPLILALAGFFDAEERRRARRLFLRR